LEYFILGFKIWSTSEKKRTKGGLGALDLRVENEALVLKKFDTIF
jgi:hypothetical protein